MENKTSSHSDPTFSPRSGILSKTDIGSHRARNRLREFTNFGLSFLGMILGVYVAAALRKQIGLDEVWGPGLAVLVGMVGLWIGLLLSLFGWKYYENRNANRKQKD